MLPKTIPIENKVKVNSRYAITNEKEFFSESFSQIMSKRMRPVSREVSKILDTYYKHQSVQTGTRTAEQYIQGKAEAANYYKNIRKREDDVDKIVQNTGFLKRFVNEVKEHVFLDVHDLYSNGHTCDCIGACIQKEVKA